MYFALLMTYMAIHVSLSGLAAAVGLCFLRMFPRDVRAMAVWGLALIVLTNALDLFVRGMALYTGSRFLAALPSWTWVLTWAVAGVGLLLLALAATGRRPGPAVGAGPDPISGPDPGTADGPGTHPQGHPGGQPSEDPPAPSSVPPPGRSAGPGTPPPPGGA